MSSKKRAQRVLLLICTALVGCGGSEPERSGARSEAAPRATASAPRDSLDPHAPRLPDLARISRYVFREMQLRQEECGLTEPLDTAIDYAIGVEVAGGAVASAQLAAAEVTVAGVKLPLSKEQWPPELKRRVACLEPYLQQMSMAPAPADGRYEARFSLAAPPSAARRAQRAPAAPEAGPDPTEPDLPDRVRLARYVFREMLAGQTACPFRGPTAGSVRYVLEVEVERGAVTRASVLREDPEGAAPPLPEGWFVAISLYGACLKPRLEAMPMAPAPRDGTYLLGFATPGVGD
jgi:hypothetical protein